MITDIAVPQLISKNKSTKDIVISVLSNEWPLSAKEIYERLLREHGTNISYQGVHKILAELENDAVVNKFGLKYQLDKLWISNIKEYIDNIDRNYKDKLGKYEIPVNFKSPLKLKFDNTTTLAVTMARLLGSRILQGANKSPRIGFLRQGMWPLEFDFAHFNILQKMMKAYNKPYVIIKKDTPFGRWIMQQYMSAGSSVIIGVDVGDLDCDLICAGECIVEIKYSDETKQMLDKIFMQISGLPDLFKEYLTKTLSNRKMEIEATITRNPQLEALLAEQLFSHFKEAK